MGGKQQHQKFTPAVVVVTVIVVLAPVSGVIGITKAAGVQGQTNENANRNVLLIQDDTQPVTHDKLALSPSNGGASAASDRGDLRVFAENESGDRVSGAKIILYDAEWNTIDTKKIASKGSVQFLDLQAGTYNLELYADGIFWGGDQVSISTDTTTKVTVSREEPHQVESRVTDEGDGDGVYEVGEPIIITPKIANDQAFPRDTRVTIILDRNQSKPWTDEVNRDPLTIPANGAEEFGGTFTPQKTGTYHVRVRVETLVNNSWILTGDSWTTSFQVSREQITVRSIDGNKPKDGIFRHRGMESMRLKLTTPEGEPIERDSVPVTIRYTNPQSSTVELRRLRFEHKGGEYVRTGLLTNTVPIQYITIIVHDINENGTTVSTKIPVIDDRVEPQFEKPIKGWANTFSNETVTVDGNKYFAVLLSKEEKRGLTFFKDDQNHFLEIKSKKGDPQGWAVFTKSGRPVTDPQIRKKAALAAFVAQKVEEGTLGRDHIISYYGDTYPRQLRRVKGAAKLSGYILGIRDIAAEAAGAVIGIYVSGGINSLTKKGAQEGAEKIVKEGAEEVVEKSARRRAAKAAVDRIKKEIIKKLYTKFISSREDLREKPLSETKKGLRRLANHELQTSATQAETAANTVENHPVGEPWSYREANRFWANYSESTIDGVFAINLRTNLLPKADAQAQLKSVTIRIFEGASGVPVDKLYNLFTSDKLGYLSDAINTTEFLYAKQTRQTRQSKEWSAEAQSAVIDTQRRIDPPLYRGGTAGAKAGVSAKIVSVSPPEGTFNIGEQVPVDVTVKNTGERQHTFFIGYSTRGPNGKFYDNHGTTGRPVTLAPGQIKTVTLDWSILSKVPNGRYNIVVAAWQESARDNLQTRLDDVRKKDIFTVDKQISEPDNTVTKGAWSQFQSTSGNTGHNPKAIGPTGDVQHKWQPFRTGGGVTSPVTVGDVIYFGSRDNSIYAVNRSMGTQKWARQTDGQVLGVAASSGTVYAASNGGHVYALNASDGNVQWKWPFPKSGASDAPTVANGIVYVPGGDDRIFALDASSGKEIWAVSTSECHGGAVQTPAVVDGVVYITEDCGQTWALNAFNGTVQWKFNDQSGRGQASPPTVADGTVYFGTVKAGAPEGNHVIAVDAATGKEKWRFSFSPSGDVKSSPAIANGTLFFGSGNGNVYAVNASDGNEVWAEPFTTSGAVLSSPAVADEIVYVGSNDGRLYVLNASTGAEIDRFLAGGQIKSSPAVANGSVYIGSEGSSLYGLVKQIEGTTPRPVSRIQFDYQDFGGETNLEVNGDQKVVEDLKQLDGTTVGNAKVTVLDPGSESDFQGSIEIIGNITSFSVGGQEFVVDNVTFGQEQSPLAEVTFTTLVPDQSFYQVTDEFKSVPSNVSMTIEPFVLTTGKVGGGGGRKSRGGFVGGNVAFNISSVKEVQSESNVTNLTFTPAAATVSTGSTTTVDVAVTSVNRGVGAAEFGVELSNESVASITDVDVGTNPGSDSTEIDSDSNGVDVKYAFDDTEDTGTITILTLTLDGESAGTTDIDIVPSDTGSRVLSDEDGATYNIANVESASLTAQSEQANSYLDNLAGDDGLQFDEVLQAISDFNTDSPPNPSFSQVLEAISRFNS